MTAPSRVPALGRLGHARDVGRRTIAANCLGEAKVEHLDDALGRDLDVGGLQIAMDDALFVRGFERLGDLARDGQRLAERQSGTA